MPPQDGTNGTTHSWASLPAAMAKSVSTLNERLKSDSWWQAFVDTKAIIEPVTFGVKSTDSDDAVLVTVSPGAKTEATTGNASKADFAVAAQPEQWEMFFSTGEHASRPAFSGEKVCPHANMVELTVDPKAPYTSFVGLQVRLPYLVNQGLWISDYPSTPVNLYGRVASLTYSCVDVLTPRA